MKFFLEIYLFIKEIYEKRYTILQLAKNDFKNRYIGSTLGFFWAIMQPFAMMIVLWIALTVFLKSGNIENIPFISWLITGLISWNYFTETLSSSTSVFQEYSYLVRKVNFKIFILPMIKIVSSLFFHVINLAILIIILFITGVKFSFYWFQVFYYLFGMIFLLLGISWIASSINVFTKDVSQIINIIIQFGFWLTPIIWNFGIIPEKYKYLFKLNPMFFIVDGYRKSFLFNSPFWQIETLWSTIYFWAISIIIFLLGIFIFRKLKPHFADVL